MKTKRIKIKDIKVDGTIKTPLLPSGFINRVQRFKKILSEVEKTTLEQTINNFQQDQHPERELRIWEEIASSYKDFIEVNPDLTIEEKKEVFSITLRLSMGVEDFDDVKRLNKEQVQFIKNSYLRYN